MHLHHLTAVASDAQRSHDFYTQVLGLHLIKQTVHYEDLASYHLYYGDAAGRPGTVVSLFIFPGLRQGGVGKGQIATLGLRIAAVEVEVWLDWLAQHNILHKYPQQRGAETVIYLEDPDGLGIELIAGPEATPLPAGDRPRVHSLYSAEIWLPTFTRLGAFFTQTLGLELIREQGQRFRYGSVDAPGHYLDILWGQDGSFGVRGTGTVDHLALQVPDDDALLSWRQRFKAAGLNPTPMRERTYFRSVYVEAVPGIVVELATEGPGFAVDEAPEALGRALQVPRWEQFRRSALQAALPKLRI
jgi:glyoxalase family protein